MATSRRQFPFPSAAAFAARAEVEASHDAPRFRCDNPQFQNAYHAGISGLNNNVPDVFQFPHPVLSRRRDLRGRVARRCPLEGLVYAHLPCLAKKTRLGTGQIQTVIPIAATAWDLYRRNPTALFLEKPLSRVFALGRIG
jgi:hypothetical protein